MISAFPTRLTITLFWSFTDIEVSRTVEPSKPDNRVTNLDNPSEIIKQAQKELVFNNSSHKEDNQKVPEPKGNTVLKITVGHQILSN